MCKSTLYAVTLALMTLIILVQCCSGNEQKTNLKILDAQFESIRQGKNIVRIKVKNNSEQDQIFRIGIYTRSPNYGPRGVGWGTSFSDTVGANETKWMRFAFKIQGPITDKTWIRLKFYNPGSQESHDSKEYFEQKRYASRDLEHYKAKESLIKPASETESEAVIQTLRHIQNLIREEKYEQAWQLFSKDYQDAEFQLHGLENFKRIMNPSQPIDSAFWWERGDFLNLQPKSIAKGDGVFTLKAISESQTWTIDFVKDDRQWKIDWIAGYTPRILLWQKWEERLLPKLEKHSTKHFDFYCFKDSTAAKEISQICEQKENGFREICQFLGKDSDVRICTVFFENEKTKHLETGHQGMGWAYGNTIVEVYNEKQKLDPYHETTHILMGSYGSPPALFNEGFAVYMSERLGTHALEDLSGGLATIYQRAREVKNEGEWIDLRELITYTEIGSMESRPPVAYPEAASFVKFLIDKYGKDKFLRAYKTLRNSDDKTVQRENTEILEQIYGKPLTELEKEWESVFLK